MLAIYLGTAIWTAKVINACSIQRCVMMLFKCFIWRVIFVRLRFSLTRLFLSNKTGTPSPVVIQL